jgi:hypothetical protein
LLTENLDYLTPEQARSLQKEANQIIQMISAIRQQVKAIKYANKAVLFTTI